MIYERDVLNMEIDQDWVNKYIKKYGNRIVIPKEELLLLKEMHLTTTI